MFARGKSPATGCSLKMTCHDTVLIEIQYTVTDSEILHGSQRYA